MPGKGEGVERREVIAEILRDQAVETQGELRRLLAERGYAVTQSSVSRDLQELGALRVEGRYRLLADVAAAEPQPAGLTDVASFVLEVASAGPYVLVVKTPPGLANSVALALDQAGWPEAIGTVAGDDTFFIATAGRRQQARIQARLAALVREAARG